tara:strand:- start:1014 stop:1952 length:939 start_codon:yes stop_codon:yes gene_type:complete
MIKYGVFLTILTFNYTNGFIHTVNEGNVGITYNGIFGGRLSNTISQPGTHFYIPIYHWMNDVNIRIQVDEFTDILCTPSEGSKMYFTIHVNNQLKEDRVYDIIKRFGEMYDNILIKQPLIQKMTNWCTDKTFNQIFKANFNSLKPIFLDHLREFQNLYNTSLEINSLTIFKPKIDPEIQNSFDIATREKSKLKAEEEKRMRLVAEEKTKQEILKLENEKLLESTNMKKKIIAVETSSEAEKIVALAEAKKKAIIKEGEAIAQFNEAVTKSENLRFTPAFLQKHWQEHVLANATLIYGEKVPTYMSPIMNNQL